MTTQSMIGASYDTKWPLEELTKHMKTRIRQLGKATWLVVSEVGMLTPKLLVMMDTILRMALDNDNPFGGLSIILEGDFYQKLCRGTPLCEVLYKYAIGGVFPKTINRMYQAVAKLFQKFRKFELTKVWRQTDKGKQTAGGEDTLGYIGSPPVRRTTGHKISAKTVAATGAYGS